MNILQEIEQNIENTALTAAQKAMLVIVKTAATPKRAYEASRGSLRAQISRNILIKLGLLSLDGIHARLTLTPQGEEAIREYNLVDDNDQLTDIGNDIVNSYLDDNKTSVQMEQYNFISKLKRSIND